MGRPPAARWGKAGCYVTVPLESDEEVDGLTPEQRERFIGELEERMREAARKFESEEAAGQRDRVKSPESGRAGHLRHSGANTGYGAPGHGKIVRLVALGEPNMSALSGADWGDYVRRCALRDESALAALYDESSQLAYTIAMRILQDEADASEVVLDVYKQVWEGATRFDEQRGSAAAWIVVLARSRAMDRRRFRAARMRDSAQVKELQEVVCPQPDPETQAIASQSGQSVRRELAVLPLEQRQVLELAFLAGLSHSEIAERLGKPLGTVKTRIRLAVAALRERLKPTYDV